MLGAAIAIAAVPAPPAAAQDDQVRYALAGGCCVLRAQSAGRLVARAANGAYTASAADAAGAERFRLQATALGRYLLYTRAAEFVAAVPSPLPILTQERVGTRQNAHEKAD